MDPRQQRAMQNLLAHMTSRIAALEQAVNRLETRIKRQEERPRPGRPPKVQK